MSRIALRGGSLSLVTALIVGVAVLLPGNALGRGADKPVSAGQPPPSVPGELIVGFKPGASEAQQAAALAQAGASRKRAFPHIHASLVGIPNAQSAQAAKELSRNPNVRYVEPNYLVKATSTFPNDPFFDQLWGLNNTGQTGGTAGADIHAPQAWDYTTGNPNLVVAVTDTGVDFSHPDLAAQQWINPGENCGSTDPTIVCAQRTNGIDDDHDGYVDDYQGWDFVNHDNNPTDDMFHGTHVAGTIGAVGNNGIGVTGVNWHVKIMALKFLDSSGNGNTADAISATLYAADHGAVVSNNSWGGGGYDQGLDDAINYATNHGMLFVAAAGNDGTNNDTTPFYPAGDPATGVVSVAASDDSDNLAYFSNYGPTTVDLAAPGVGIYSTFPGGGYEYLDGTSMATPHVAGTVALIKSEFPSATPYGIKALLLGSVDRPASLDGTSVSNGRLNAFNAVSCSNKPEVLLDAPVDGFGVGSGDSLPIRVIGANCAVPAGLSNVSVTVNGAPVALSASSPDSGLYTGTYTVGSAGPVTVTATVTVGGLSSATQTVTGTAIKNYTCSDVAYSWHDVTTATNLHLTDDSFATIALPFPVSFYGASYSTAYVSSNGFLTLGSSSGATANVNVAIPNTAAPNGLIAPFWEDLNPSAGGGVYGGWSGTAPNRYMTFEWFNVPRYPSTGAGTVEVTLFESGEIRFRYQDTDFGDSRWNAGASATAGVETTSGAIGRQYSYNQPVLTSGKAVSCNLGTSSPPTITTSSLKDATNTVAYSDTLTATGGSPPYTFSVDSGSLPNGLVLNASTGAIMGTPNATSGNYPFTSRVTDSASQTSTKALQISVADPLQITTASLPGGTTGQLYSQTVTATGGKTAYTWGVSAGALPPGLSLTQGTPSATLSGTPTTAGSYSFTLKVTDSGSPARTATQAYSVTVTASSSLAITSSNVPTGKVGSPYLNASVTASGGVTPYAWSITVGTLPPGLTLVQGTPTVTISGTPTKPGSYTFTIQVKDATNAVATKSLLIKITKR